MMFVDFQYEGRPVVRCWFAAGPVTEAYSSYRIEFGGRTQLPRLHGRLSSLGRGAEVGKKEGVHNVHTLGFGLGRSGTGLGRIADVCGGVAAFQVLNPVRVPPRAQCCCRSGAFCGIFRVHIVHTPASDPIFGVCGSRNGLFGCVGERLTTADRVPPCGASSECELLR